MVIWFLDLRKSPKPNKLGQVLDILLEENRVVK